MADNWNQARQDHRVQQSEAIAASALSLLLEGGASALTMAEIANRAEISRQTLYRYFSDVDAVLVAVAELIAAHDEHFEAQVHEQAGPTAQLDYIIRGVAHADGHDAQARSTLYATLPPAAREVLARHEEHVAKLLADTLIAGIDAGLFRAEIDPAADAPLLLGLASAASNPRGPDRALTLVHRIVHNHPQEDQQ